LERAYQAASTAHVRVLHPFYTDKEIVRLDARSQPAEIALHAEFAHHARFFGSDLDAGQASRAHLEKVLGRPVRGVSVHGGELTDNTLNATEAIEGCGFLYAVAGSGPYWFPYRRLTPDGQLESTYYLRAHLNDIAIERISLKHFAKTFYEQAMLCLDASAKHNGVFVLLLHPVFLGLLGYLLDFKGLARFLRFLPTYLGMVLKLKKNQENINVQEDASSRQAPRATLRP
jgi:hypothetical protein